MSLRKKTVNYVACGSQFVVSLGSNLKRELPGLRLNLKKLSNHQASKKHKRNHDGDTLSQASADQTSVFGQQQQKHSSHSLDRTKTVQPAISNSMMISRSNKKKNTRSFHRLLKRESINNNSYSKSQSSMNIYPSGGIMIGNGALNSQFHVSPLARDSAGKRSRSIHK